MIEDMDGPQSVALDPTILHYGSAKFSRHFNAKKPERSAWGKFVPTMLQFRDGKVVVEHII